MVTMRHPASARSAPAASESTRDIMTTARGRDQLRVDAGLAFGKAHDKTAAPRRIDDWNKGQALRPNRRHRHRTASRLRRHGAVAERRLSTPTSMDRGQGQRGECPDQRVKLGNVGRAVRAVAREGSQLTQPESRSNCSRNSRGPLIELAPPSQVFERAPTSFCGHLDTSRRVSPLTRRRG